MATNFPGSLDSFTNPTSSSTLDSPSHASQHANINDAMEAVQTKLGTGDHTIGDAVSFTPTWTNGVTVGNGTITAHYVETNDFISYSIDFALGSTSAITGDVRLEHPIQSNNTYQAPATCRGFAFDASAGIYYAVMGTAYNTSEMRVRWMRQSSATDSIFGSDLSSGAFPFTWGTSDRLVFGTYYRRA